MCGDHEQPHQQTMQQEPQPEPVPKQEGPVLPAHHPLAVLKQSAPRQVSRRLVLQVQHQHPSLSLALASLSRAAPQQRLLLGTNDDELSVMNARQHRQKQRDKAQRLLLLRHSSKCPHEVGSCPVTRHCADMKHLWNHMAECNNKKCLVSHCVSSKYVLVHFRRCRDHGCYACCPVRHVIRQEGQMEQLRQQFEAL